MTVEEMVSRTECTGCKACGDVCKAKAISFPSDHEGFWHPSIEAEKCIHCGLCVKVCPVREPHYSAEDSRSIPKTYKVYHKDKHIRYNSTSGALYYALAQGFVERGDYIVGCVYDDGYTGAHHEASNTLEGLRRIMRSKYFQSDTEGIFQEVKSLLVKGEKVLFCGTGCQVSGLNGFLGKHYENLYTVELICRGINSPIAFTSYMEELRKRFHSEIKEVHFKNKSHGWTNLGTLVTFENGKSYYRNRRNDPWVNGFIVGNLYLRPSCEQCKCKSFPRVADITIGDFWGLQFSEEEEKYGVSVALVNNEKGDRLLDMARRYMYVEERNFDEALKGNLALVNSVKLNPRRKEFFERIGKEPYSKVVWDLLGSSTVKRMIAETKERVKTKLRTIYHKWKGR
jgi:coenzyme F420-reducing hydrogenase beta subunit